MTDHDAVLLQLGSLNGVRVRGPVVVCQGHGEQPDETPARWAIASKLSTHPIMAQGNHTGEEARFIVAHGDDEVTIVTHGYHVPRVLLSLVKALRDAEREYQLRCWFVGVPGLDHKWVLEQEKIARYQHEGLIATYAEAIQYLQWRNS